MNISKASLSSNLRKLLYKYIIYKIESEKWKEGREGRGQEGQGDGEGQKRFTSNVALRVRRLCDEPLNHSLKIT